MKIGSLERSNSIKNNYKQLLLVLIVAICGMYSCNTSDQAEVFVFSGTTMGTTYSIKIVADHEIISPNLQEKIDSILIELNKQMSTYINESEISKFNKATDTNWYSVSEDLATLIYDAKKISAETDYFYDVTIGPVVNLWGFGPGNVAIKIPSDEEIATAKTKTGFEKLKVDLNSVKIKKTNSDIYCDLSSIAKGFGVDKVGLFLENELIQNYMVEIGGEVRTKGQNSQSENWKIGISTPNSDGLQKILSISNVSVATSGDYLNYFEKNGIRYSHLIDSKTGKPITHNLASVTVIHENCKEADAYATAINVMGPKTGYELALKKKLPIFMIVREKDNFTEKMTPQFEEYIVKGN